MLPVLLFTLAVSMAAALLFGLAPALQLSGRDILTPLKEAGRGVAGGVRQRLLRGTGGGRSRAFADAAGGREPDDPDAARDPGRDLGFHPDRILTLRIPVSEQRYPDADRRVALLQEVLRRIRPFRACAR